MPTRIRRAQLHDDVFEPYYTRDEVDALLASLGSSDGYPLSEAQYLGLTGGDATNLHTHYNILFGMIQDRPVSYPPGEHVLATTSGLSPEHTVSGLTAGQVLQATGETTAAFAALDWSSIANKPAAFAPVSHSHDDLYYTQVEVDALLAGYARLAAANVFTAANYFSPTLAAGTYSVQITGAAGAARDVFLAGLTGFSNGFTVQYTGTAMRYAFHSGNVGIGTAVPEESLHIHGGASDNAAKTLLHLSTIGGYQSYGAKLQIVRGGSLAQKWKFISRRDGDGAEIDALNISDTGRLGILTASPNRELEVNGNMRLSAANPILDWNSNTLTLTSYSAAIPVLHLKGNAYDPRFDITKADGSTVAVRICANADSHFSGGNVGIGLPDPQVLLQVHKSTGKVPLRLSYSRDYGWELSNTSTDAMFRLEYMSGNGVHATALTASFEGRVGIRTTPSASYDLVVGGTGGIATFGSNFYKTGGSLNLYVDGGNHFLFRDSGGGNNTKVGIGTGSPSDALEVNGGLAVLGVNTGAQAQPASLNLGYSSDQGYLQAVDWGVAYKNLMLQPHGSNVGIGIALGTAPQGKLHIHDGTGGMMFVSKSGIGATPVTLIANGTGDVMKGCQIVFVARSSGGNPFGGETFIQNGGNYLLGYDPQWRFNVNADGSLTIVRTIGTATLDITALIVWH